MPGWRACAGGMQTLVATNLIHPLGLVFDSKGNLFIANQGGSNIVEVTPAGAQSIFASTTNGDSPSALAFKPMLEFQSAIVNNKFVLTVSTPSPYASTIVEATTNLLPVDWVAVYTNTPPFIFTDSASAGLRQRFYRVVQNP
jgi:hypothetical protein